MRVLQSARKAGGGLSLHLQAWEPDSKPKAVVALVHGLGEHIGRYGPFGEDLVKRGYALMGLDLRGHGRSGGRRGHASSYAELMDDIDILLGWVREHHPHEPVYLYGHSLGGGLVLNYALRRAPRLQGVIASSPWLRSVVPTPGWKLAMARVASLLLPTFTQHWGLKPSDLTHDASAVALFEVDPLTHGLVSARMFMECAQAGEWALEHAAEFPLPLLLMHGTADRLTSWEASQEFARRAGSRAMYRLWDGYFHELHNETQRGAVVKTTVAWMNRRLENRNRTRRSAGQMRPDMRKSRPNRRTNS